MYRNPRVCLCVCVCGGCLASCVCRCASPSMIGRRAKKCVNATISKPRVTHPQQLQQPGARAGVAVRPTKKIDVVRLDNNSNTEQHTAAFLL